MPEDNSKLVMQLFQEITLTRELAEDCPLDEEERALLRAQTCELQTRLGLFRGDLAELGDRASLQDFLRGYKPVHVPSSVPALVEPEMKLVQMPFKFFFAVWGRVAPAAGQQTIDVVYDGREQHTLRALEIGLAMRGHWHQDGWISVANLLHEASRKGWACLPADEGYLVSYVCVRCIYGPDALPLAMGHADPPTWPKPWPHRSVMG